MSYWGLCLIMMAIAAVGVGLLVATGARPGWRAVLIGLVVLLALTAVFDSAMIAVGLVAYDPDTLLGIHLGPTPIEDFSYAVVAGVGAPVLFSWLRRNRPDEEGR